MTKRSVALGLALPVLWAGSAQAQAQMIAGWDFSQYAGANFLIDSSGSFVNTLDANYSNLDPTFGAGAESAAFGTMLMDGAAGSTNVDPQNSPQFVPTAGSLASNIAAGVPGSEPFDSQLVLLNEGQAFFNLLSMTAAGAVDVVFAADLSSIGGTGSGWSFSFGGQTFSGATSVEVMYSTDGSSYSSAASPNLSTVDTQFSVPLGLPSTDVAFVKLSFQAPGGGGLNQAIIDNVAILADSVTVPGPSVTVEIDVEQREINPSSRGVIPVAILGSETFDVADVDATTLAFGPGGATLAHRNGPHPKDANHDGTPDLLAHFSAKEAGIPTDAQQVCVTGKLLDGTPFEGCDAIGTVPPQ